MTLIHLRIDLAVSSKLGVFANNVGLKSGANHNYYYLAIIQILIMIAIMLFFIVINIITDYYYYSSNYDSWQKELGYSIYNKNMVVLNSLGFT